MPSPQSITVPSPIGPLAVVGDAGGVHRIRFAEEPPCGADPRTAPCPGLSRAGRQLEAYFARELTEFDIPLTLSGTPFQLWVWAQLRRIPYGTTTTYGALARRRDAERPHGPRTSPRAIASAVARTPVPIILACHRVLGSDGSLTGYRGGLGRKRALLDLEGPLPGPLRPAAAPGPAGRARTPRR